MTRGTQLLLATAALLLTACPSDDVLPGNTETGDSSGTGGMTMPPTTMPPTTMPPTTMPPTTITGVDSSTTDDPSTSGSSSTTDDPDTGSSTTDDSGSSSSTTDPGSSSSSTTDEPGSSSSSTTDEPGSSSSTTDEPGTSSTTDDPGMEGFGDCDADPMACLDGEICFTGGAPVEVSFCGLQDCAGVGDCPDAPAGGDAPVVCTDVTGDMINECIIDCSEGQVCPDGMECFADIACGWPAEPPPPPMGEGFGDCNADPMVCIDGEICFTGGDPVEISFCGFQGCADVDGCPDAPPGGDAPVACIDVTGDMVNECIIDCGGGQTCPDGMECFADIACGWPAEPPPPPPPPMGEGFGDCLADPVACLDGETCVVDDVDMPTVGVCGFTVCDVPADCPDRPPGGDAPVACEELLGDGNGDCFIDCSGGQTCPDGMECAFDILCAWPGV